MRKYIVLVALALLSSCGSVVGDGTAGATLVGKEWRLISIGGVAVSADSKSTAQFDPAGQIVGNGGVNRYRGTYTLDGARISVGPLMSTKMAGPPAAMQAETAFLSALGSARSYQLTGSTLTITGDAGVLVLQS